MEQDKKEFLNSDLETTVTISEYEMIKQLREEYEKNSKYKEMTEDEIDNLKNYEADYVKHIEEMNKLTDDELKILGYNQEQINAIRNFDGTDEYIAKSSARVSLSISKNSSSYSGGKTKLNVKVRFVWSGVPTFLFKDGFGVTNGEGMYFDNLQTLFTTTYISTTNSQRTYKGNLKRTDSGNTGATTTFQVYRSEGPLRYYLKSGSANVPLNRAAKLKQCGIGIAYGHSYFYPNISVSVSGTGNSVGISFSSKVTKYSTSKVFVF